MKKILSIVIIISTLLSMSTVAFAADNDFTITLSEAKGKKDSVVEVVAVLSDNPGMAGLTLTLDYDQEALTFEGYTNGTVFATAPTVEKNFVWAGSGDTVVNGTLVTLKFRINDAAVAGESYTVSFKLRECSNGNLEALNGRVVSGKITVEGDALPAPVFIGANIELYKDITVKFHAELDDVYASAKMRFTMNGDTTEVDGIKTEEGTYIYPFRQVAPQCMGDTIKAELIFNGKVIGTLEDYSVLKYCQNQLAAGAAKLGISEEKYAALKVLIADMLEYGAKAQNYCNYKVDKLVNAGISGKSNDVDLTETHMNLGESSLEGVGITAAGVYFDYVNSLYVKFKAPGMTEDNFYILSFNDRTGEEIEYRLSDCELINESTSEYVLKMDPVELVGCEDLYYIELWGLKGSSTTRFEAKQSLEYSVKSYVYSMQNKSNVSHYMKELAVRLYNYGLSAKAYSEID